MKRTMSLTLLAVAAAFAGAGCSSQSNSVEVKVTLDGAPLEGATVVFTQDGGVVTATGYTDANGVCTLTTGGGKPGVPPGKYKATVSKTPAMTGMPTNVDPEKGAAAMQEMMSKTAADQGPKGGGPKGGGPKGAGPAQAKPKNMVPAKYGDANQTPFTGIEVPSKGQVALDLKSDASGK